VVGNIERVGIRAGGQATGGFPMDEGDAPVTDGSDQCFADQLVVEDDGPLAILEQAPPHSFLDLAQDL
jgi:hypothetical protein